MTVWKGIPTRLLLSKGRTNQAVLPARSIFPAASQRSCKRAPQHNKPEAVAGDLFSAHSRPAASLDAFQSFDRQVPTCLYCIMADIFEALATPARRAILDELCERDGQTLFELCARLTMKHGLGLTRQAVSQHIDVLESAGLVRSERQGRCKFHYLNTDPLKAIIERWLKPGRKGDRR